MEKYYLAERIKDCFIIDAFNTDVLKQSGNSLEMLSSKVIKPEEHGIKVERNKVICVNGLYDLKEVSKEKAMETLEEMSVNYSLWQSYMSNPDDEASLHLGQGGDFLY